MIKSIQQFQAEGVRNQAEMLVTAENILKQKKEDRFGQEQPDMIIKRLKVHLSGKIR